jgi:hypothetical protein
MLGSAAMETVSVFTRRPEPGGVKTRLSPALPAALASDLQRAMLADTLAAVLASRAARRVIHWADGATAGFPEAAGFTAAVQRGEGLGARLEAAVEELFGSGGGPLVIVGSDAPELGPEALNAGLEALDQHDVALAPTPDGGFHLIGLSRPIPGLFDEVPWSSERTLEALVERATALGKRVARLEPIADVDTPADLVALIARLVERASRAPATAAALAAIGLLPRPA